jgi:hypothetical protein
MLRCLAFLLLLANPAMAQLSTRPTGTEGIPAPIVLPEAGLPQAPLPAPPAQPGRPIPFGGFKPLAINPPSIERLFSTITKDLTINRSRQSVTYLRYTPGGKQRYDKNPIVVAAAPGSDLLGIAATLNLHPEARAAGRALLLVIIQRTSPEQTSNFPTSNLTQGVNIAADARQDGIQAGMLIDAVLQAESLFDPYSLVGMADTGSKWMDFLCLDRSRSRQPTLMFLMDGTLRADSASACNPPRMPTLVTMQDLQSTTSPVRGGQSDPIPGQVTAGQLLSSATTLTFWALAARCDESPTLSWLPLQRGRLALQVNGNCRRGGPVALLTLVDGQLNDEQRSILVRTALNGELLGTQ